MKLRYIFTAIVSSLCLLVACQQEDPSSLGTIQLEKTFLTIPLEGGSVDLNLVASAPWAFAKSVLINKDPETYAELPAWLTASALSGETGAAKITFTAAANGFGREQELQINTGSQIQYIIVRQGSMEAEKASCAEVIAGADGKTYTVTGTCTSIANTTYGNWYLNDGKDEIYIYGTLDKDGGTKNFLSLGIEVGDVITVQGPKTTYGTTVELVDVTVLKIVKSLLKVDKTEFKDLDKDGAEFSIKAAFKGVLDNFVNSRLNVLKEVDKLKDLSEDLKCKWKNLVISTYKAEKLNPAKIHKLLACGHFSDKMLVDALSADGTASAAEKICSYMGSVNAHFVELFGQEEWDGMGNDERVPVLNMALMGVMDKNPAVAEKFLARSDELMGALNTELIRPDFSEHGDGRKVVEGLYTILVGVDGQKVGE